MSLYRILEGDFVKVDAFLECEGVQVLSLLVVDLGNTVNHVENELTHHFGFEEGLEVGRNGERHEHTNDDCYQDGNQVPRTVDVIACRIYSSV